MLVASSFSSSFFLHVLFVLLSLAPTTIALHNVTVDDSDPSIVYAGNWENSNPSNSLNIGGFHHLTTDPGATATFTFTGTAVYYLAPKWPYSVGATISLNGGAGTFVSLNDPFGANINGVETVASAVVWSRTGLNGTNKVVVSFPSGQAQYGVVDAFIVTVQDPSDTASSTPPPTSSHSSTPIPTQSQPSSDKKTGNDSTDSSHKNTHDNLAIILGSSLGSIALIFIIISVFLIRRNKKKNDPHRYYPPTQAIQRQESDGVYPISLSGASIRSGGAGGAGIGAHGVERGSDYIVEPLTIPSLYSQSQYSDPMSKAPWPIYQTQGDASSSNTAYVPTAMKHPYNSTSSGGSGSMNRLSGVGTGVTDFGGKDSKYSSMYSSNASGGVSSSALGQGSSNGKSDTKSYYGGGTVTMEYRPGIGQTITTTGPHPPLPPLPSSSQDNNYASGSGSGSATPSGSVPNLGMGWGRKNGSDANLNLRTNRDTKPDDPPLYTRR